jgi:capsular exopolysaccharide synthesis family protein
MSGISRAIERANQEDRKRTEGAPASRRGRVVTGAALGRLAVPNAGEYQALASEIAMALPEAPSRVITFASSVAGEGTSTVAREFAMVLAIHGAVETLLVDANLRRPSLHEVFRIAPAPGLSDHILADALLSDCVRSVGVAHLSLLPAGRPVIAPPRVSGHERMDGMLSELRRRFRYVVLDVPPILPFAEGIVLSRRTDGIVVVIQAGRTRRQLVERTMELLGGAGANVLGTVLNRRRFYIPKFVYERL